MQSSEFIEKCPSLEEGKPSKRTNALFSRLFAGELQFHVRKEPQNDPQNNRKNFWQLFDKLVNFY